VPTVYWKHYFDWGADLRNKIQALINARKVAGVNAGSPLHLQHNAQIKGIYAAGIVGRNGDLYVRIGGGDRDWQPFYSGYADYREYARGDGWKVWVGLPGNPGLQQAPLRAALPVPDYREPSSFAIPDDLLNGSWRTAAASWRAFERAGTRRRPLSSSARYCPLGLHRLMRVWSGGRPPVSRPDF
jgi:alpha-amylase